MEIYLQETSLCEKLYFFSLVPVPNCSRTNARNSLIYLYCFAVWVLLYLAFAVTYDCVANNTRNIYLVEGKHPRALCQPAVKNLQRSPQAPQPCQQGSKALWILELCSCSSVGVFWAG